MPRVVRHENPDRCVVGTVGEPGSRTFFIQARSGSLLTSVVVEKMQVAALADRIDEVLDEVVRRSGGRADVPAVTPTTVSDLGPLDVPLEEEFRATTLALAWVGEDERLELRMAVGDDTDDTDEVGVATDQESEEETARTPPDETSGGDDRESQVLVVRLTGAQARAFVSRARAVVAAGRPPCPFCSQPLDPSGHLCPRQNGFHRRR